MNITIEQVLLRNVLRDSFVAAGITGISNEVERISFIDGPIDEDYFNTPLLSPNTFYVSSFYFTKDDEDYFYYIIKALIDTGSSGIGIFDQFIHKIPTKIEKLANENNYPIIFFDNDIPYHEIITAFMEEVTMEQRYVTNQIIIDSILNSKNIYPEKKMANLINKYFKSNIVSIYFTGTNKFSNSFQRLSVSIRANEEHAVFVYLKGSFVFLSYDDMDLFDIKKETDEVLSKIDKFFVNTKIGVSSSHKGYGKFKICIEESLMAQKLSSYMDKKVTGYKELGIYKLLLNVIDSPISKSFADEFFEPLIIYDNKNSMNLVDTAKIYVKYEGDFRKTAQAMFLHENTIRHRIKLIQKLTNCVGRYLSFCEELTTAVKILQLSE